MILKVISDGTPDGTKVINSETGENVGGICEVSWILKYDQFAEVTIKMYADVQLASLDVEKVIIEAGASTYSEMQDDETLKDVRREEAK